MAETKTRARLKSGKSRAAGKSTKATPKRAVASAATSASLDLSTLDRAALVELRKEVDRALQSYDRRKREDALREMEAVAQKHGLALKDVVRAGVGRSLALPKYRHPENPALTWSGRGRQPSWYKEAVNDGRNPEDLLIS